MTNISYFVIENGADINLGSKGRIVARKIKVNKYIKYKDDIFSKNKYYPHAYNNAVVKSPFNKNLNYGVIVNAQAPYDSNELPGSGVFNGHYKYKWFTAAVALKKDENNIYLSLDRGETVLHHKNEQVYDWLTSPQEVAYLTVYGSGQYKGLLFSLGGDNTPRTLGNDNLYNGFSNVTIPSKTQCDALTDIPYSSQFKGLPLIMASKNSRNGSDGGIFRLCRLQANPLKVSFVTDEDLNEPRRGKTNESCGGQSCIERRHDTEKFGFMAFQQVVDAKTCELFPGPAQTWDKYNGNILIDGKSEIENTHLLDGKRYLGFPYNSIKGTNVFEGCDGKQCRSLPDLMPNKQKISDIPESDFNIIIRKDTIWRDGGTYNNVRFEGEETLTLYSGIYYFNSLLIGNNAKVYIPKGQNVRIYTHYFNMADNSEFESEDMTANGDLSGVVFVKNGGQQPSDMLNFVDFNKAEFNGYLYAEKMVHLSGCDSN